MAKSKQLSDEQLSLYESLTAIQKACVDIKLVEPALSYGEIYRKVKNITAADGNAYRHSRRYGFTIFDNDNVKAFLRAINIETIDDLIVTRNNILNDLQDIAEIQINDLVSIVHEDDTFMNVDSGEMISGVKSFTIKRIEDIPDNAWKAVKKMKQGKYGIEIELYDAVSVRKTINEMQGYNAPVRTELTGKDGSPMQTVQLTPEQVASLNNGLENEY